MASSISLEAIVGDRVTASLATCFLRISRKDACVITSYPAILAAYWVTIVSISNWYSWSFGQSRRRSCLLSSTEVVHARSIALRSISQSRNIFASSQRGESDSVEISFWTVKDLRFAFLFSIILWIFSCCCWICACASAMRFCSRWMSLVDSAIMLSTRSSTFVSSWAYTKIPVTDTDKNTNKRILVWKIFISSI